MEPISRTDLATCYAQLTSRLEALVSDHNRSSDPRRQFSISVSTADAIEVCSSSATVRIELVVSRAELVVAFLPNNRHDSGVMALHRIRRSADDWFFDGSHGSLNLEQFAAECLQRLRSWE